MSNKKDHDDVLDAELEEMMDIEFPSFNSKVEKGTDEVLVPTIDIQNDGWDDDAVVVCLNLAICNHDGNSYNNSYDFHPIPNMRKDASGKQCKLEYDVGSITDHLDGSRKSAEEKTRSEVWNPSEMMKPRWASNPTIEESS